MARFCIQCGQQLKEGVAFCGNCGQPAQGQPMQQPVQQASQAPQQNWGAPTPPGKPKGSPVVKILLICLAVFMVFGMIAMGGLFYAGYKVKQKVEQAASESGINLKDLTASSEKGRTVADSCALMTKEEASRILEVEVVRTEAAGDACHYYQAAVSTEQQQQNLNEALERMKKAAAEGDQGRGHPEDVAKAMVGAMANSSAPVVTVTVSADGRQQMAGMKIAMGALGGTGMSHSVPGLGDEALMGPMDSILLVVKNGTGIEVDLRMLQQGKEKGIAIARQVMSRL